VLASWLFGALTMTVPVRVVFSTSAYVKVPEFWLKVYENAPPGIMAPELNIPVLFPIVEIEWETLSLFTQLMPVPGSTTSVWGVKPLLVM